jgi:hypothetical protein
MKISDFKIIATSLCILCIASNHISKTLLYLHVCVYVCYSTTVSFIIFQSVAKGKYSTLHMIVKICVVIIWKSAANYIVDTLWYNFWKPACTTTILRLRTSMLNSFENVFELIIYLNNSLNEIELVLGSFIYFIFFIYNYMYIYVYWPSLPSIVNY